jgi:hypothetical protein
MATLNISTTENTNEILNNNTLNDNPSENPTEIRSEIPDSDLPTKKKGKEKIPLSVKNTLWSLNYQNILNVVCQCNFVLYVVLKYKQQLKLIVRTLFVNIINLYIY